jgi:hypothetical protein
MGLGRVTQKGCLIFWRRERPHKYK